MNLNLRSSLILLCLLALGCRRQTTHSERTDLNERSYIQILERIERAGNRYREAMDLQKYTSSAVERSLADSHLQLTRSRFPQHARLRRNGNLSAHCQSHRA